MSIITQKNNTEPTTPPSGSTTIYPDATTKKLATKDDSGAVTSYASEQEAEQVKVSANDTTKGYLESKFVAGANVTITTLNDGANETLSIAAASGGGGNNLVGIHPIVDTEAVLGDLFTTSLDTAVEVPNITLNILANQKYTFSIACQARGTSLNGIRIGLRSSNSSKFTWAVEGPNTSSTNIRRESLPFPPVADEFLTVGGFGANNGYNYIRAEGLIFGGATDGTIKIIIASFTAGVDVYITSTSLILNKVP